MGTFLELATDLLIATLQSLVSMLSCAWVQALMALVVVAFTVSLFKRLTT